MHQDSDCSKPVECEMLVLCDQEETMILSDLEVEEKRA